MVIILRGVSGSGKSTLARSYAGGDVVSTGPADLHLQQLSNDARKTILSTDHYMMKDGEYVFDANKLPQAHGSCLKRFAHEMERSLDQNETFVIDNTNCSIAEVAPYAALALAYSHNLHIITLIGDPVGCWMRSRRGVSFGTVFMQDTVLRRSLVDWPHWFPQQIFPSG